MTVHTESAPPRYASNEIRYAFGKQQRDCLPRMELARLSLAANRSVVDTVRTAAVGRIASLLPYRFGRMKVSPFSFFRGSALQMASDLVAGPSSQLIAQICGDAHLRNLGANATQDGSVEFDLNDFDETVRAPWEWDLKRMVASVVLGGREAGNSDSACREAVAGLVRAYRDAQLQFSALTSVEVALFRVERSLQKGPVRRILKKAERQSPGESLTRITQNVDGLKRFVDSPPKLGRATEAEAELVRRSLLAYRETLNPCWRHALDGYAIIDVARRVSGTGSVGLPGFAILMAGPTPDDFLLLQLKEARRSCFGAFVSEGCSHHGRRVAEGQLAIQRISDPFLGWTSIGEGHFLVRQLANKKESVDDDDLRGDGLTEYAGVCGELLARAHARTGDPATLAGYLGKSDQAVEALTEYAVVYADQVCRDFEIFQGAIREGLFPVLNV